MGLKRGVRTMGVKGQKDNAGIRVEKKIGQSSIASATIKITLKVIVVWLTMSIQRFCQMIYHPRWGGGYSLKSYSFQIPNFLGIIPI